MVGKIFEGKINKEIVYAGLIFLQLVMMLICKTGSDLKDVDGNRRQILTLPKMSVEYKREQLNDKLNFDSTAKKVMFVAHPDDETLWGGNALYHEKYLVVCITCGVDSRRVEEFRKVMALTNDDYIMLGYPDKIKNVRNDWEKEPFWDDLNADIAKILKLKDWDLVVTHNPDGEYGHIHHKLTNKIVVNYPNKDKIYFFGRFYWKKIPNPDKLYRLNDDEFDFKTNKALVLYKTQYHAIKTLSNMIHYENWISYNEWYKVEDEGILV